MYRYSEAVEAFQESNRLDPTVPSVSDSLALARAQAASASKPAGVFVLLFLTYYFVSLDVCAVCIYVRMHVCMYVRMHACMYVCMYACMCVYVYVCMLVIMYVIMGVCMHVRM